MPLPLFRRHFGWTGTYQHLYYQTGALTTPTLTMLRLFTCYHTGLVSSDGSLLMEDYYQDDDSNHQLSNDSRNHLPLDVSCFRLASAFSQSADASCPPSEAEEDYGGYALNFVSACLDDSTTSHLATVKVNSLLINNNIPLLFPSTKEW